LEPVGSLADRVPHKLRRIIFFEPVSIWGTTSNWHENHGVISAKTKVHASLQADTFSPTHIDVRNYLVGPEHLYLKDYIFTLCERPCLFAVVGYRVKLGKSRWFRK